MNRRKFLQMMGVLVATAVVLRYAPAVHMDSENAETAPPEGGWQMPWQFPWRFEPPPSPTIAQHRSYLPVVKEG